jgi:hypothetical protein
MQNIPTTCHVCGAPVSALPIASSDGHPAAFYVRVCSLCELPCDDCVCSFVNDATEENEPCIML